MIDDDRDYVDLDVCAKRMNLSKAEVMEMVRLRALRGCYLGGELWVEPALVNVRPTPQ